MTALASTILLAIAASATPPQKNVPPSRAALRAVVTNTNEAKSGISAYGFCMGQKLSIEVAIELYPDLASEARLIEREFDRNTGNACQDIESAAQIFFDEHKTGVWASLKAEMSARLNKELRPQFRDALSTHMSAKQFLETVRARGMGDIPTVTAQPLIGASQQFRTHPGSQWKHWSKVWRSPPTTSNEDKFHIKVPTSFEEKNPSSANMIQKWTQRVGFDGTHIMLSVSRFPYQKGENQSEAEIEFSTSDPAKLASEMTKSMQTAVLDTRRVKIMNRPAVIVTTRTKVTNLSITTETTQRQLIVAGVHGVLIVACAATLNESEAANHNQMFETIAPLCDLYMNSFAWN